MFTGGGGRLLGLFLLISLNLFPCGNAPQTNLGNYQIPIIQSTPPVPMYANNLYLSEYSESIIIGEKIECFYETPHPYYCKEENNPIWKLEIKYENASYIAPHFKNFDLAEGDFVIVHSPDNKYKYRYENKGLYSKMDFLSYSIPGDTVIIELFANPKNTAYGFIIDYYGRGYSEDELKIINNIDSFAISTWENIKCIQGTPVYEKAKAISRIKFTGLDGYEHKCTAWLVSCEGHLITNSHCISKQWQADDMQIEFMADASSCNDSSCDCTMCCPGEIWEGENPPEIITFKHETDKDYTILKISKNSSNIYPSDIYGYIKIVDYADPYEGYPIYILHHPYAWAKKITRYKNDGSGAFCILHGPEQYACSNYEWWYNCDTAPGSSGGADLYQNNLMAILLNNCGYMAGYTNFGVNINKISQDLQGVLPACSFFRAKIYGYITLNGQGIPNIKVTACSKTSYTSNDGYYEITNLKDDSSCTVKPSYTTPNGIDYSFTPNKKDVYIGISDIRQDFIVNTYALSGHIIKNQEGLKDVIIELKQVNGSINKMAISNEYGYYEITSLPNDKYAIDPYYTSQYGTDCAFSPPNITEIIENSNKQNIDFQLNTFSINGNIFYNGNPIIHNIGHMEDVNIYVNGIFGFKTSSDGHYLLFDLCPSTYKIEPVYYDSKGYRLSFNPPYQMVTITNSNVEGINFEVQTFQIAGWITQENIYNCLFNNANVYLSIYLDNKFATNSLLSGNPCEYFINGIPNGRYYITGRNPDDNTHYCITPAGYTVLIQDGSVHDRNFAVYIGKIEGYVKEIIHDKDQNGNPITTTVYIEDAKVEILGKNQFDYTDINGHYGFVDVASNWYDLKAKKTITLPDDETYTKTYNPNPKQVKLCIADELNQDFYMHLYVLDKPPMQVIGRFGPMYPESVNINLSEVNFIAASSDYWTEKRADINGYAEIPLPGGTYNVYALKECNTFYPPYLTINVSEFQRVPKQNFTISGWSVCDRCYATLYYEQNDCLNRMDRDECLLGAKLKFKNCISLKTSQANSDFYNAILLSVQVNRSTGKPEEILETFTVEEEGEYWINITNGDCFNKSTAVSSAEINIEGIGQIFGPNDFNKNVFHLKKQIHLTQCEYEISSVLRSQPDSYLTIVISNKDISSFQELP